MLKLLAAGATVLFVTLSPTAFAQAPSAMGPARLGQADLAKLTDERIAIVKSVLQLTPDQEKYWPAVADAIRVRAQNRDARLTRIAETVGKMSDESANDVLRNRDPVAFLERRADALAQRAQDLKKLADAWRPLYPTLSPEQKQRLAALTIFALHQVGSALEQRMQSDDDDEWLVIMR
jgi:LTXXQ motif family protein